jgi:UDP-N-acetylglucosamine--N-acetylmuramyl-(pentapeptide) pyrophosphoryl-undecaprenol N-acetylglucosamine transferase
MTPTRRSEVRVYVSGGGTAGHIYPALAVARLVADSGRDAVTFVGVPGSLEERLASEAGIPFLGVRAQGWDRARPLTFVTGVLTTIGSLFRCVGMLRSDHVDAVCGFGGYVSLPLGLAAAITRVPLVVHEQNAVPGLVNRVLGRWADVVCLTYADSHRRLPSGARTVVTGNPVRSSVIEADRSAGRVALGVSDEDTVLLVFGGSRGARHLNNAILDLYPRLRYIPRLHIVHVAGPTEAATVREALVRAAGGEAPAWWGVREYVDEMGDLIAAADLVVCRAGATTLAELSALAKPMVLVPYPYATDDHQTLNAEPFVVAGGAVAIADSSLDDPRFGDAVIGLLSDPDARAVMGRRAGGLGRTNAAEAVVDEIRASAAPAAGRSHCDTDEANREGRS